MIMGGKPSNLSIRWSPASPTPPAALLDLPLPSVSFFWTMSSPESPEPLMPARALVFAVAHRTTGDGVKKHTMHARRVRLARRRVRLVDSFDRHCNDWRYGTRSVQESYHGRGKERHEAEGLLAPVLPRGLFRRTSRLGPLLTLTVVLSAIRLSFPTTTLAFLILDKEVH